MNAAEEQFTLIIVEKITRKKLIHIHFSKVNKLKGRYIPFIIWLAAALSLFIGCSEPESNIRSDSESEKQIVLKSDSLYQTVIFYQKVVYTDSLLLDEIQDITVGDAGTVFIAGKKWNHLEVHKFSSNGSYIGSIGQFGKAPGAFEAVNRIQFNGSDIWVSDTQLNRITRFDISTGSVQEMINLDSLFQRISADSKRSFATIDPVGLIDSDRLLVKLANERNPIYQPESEFSYAFLNRSQSDSLRIEPITEAKSRRYVVGDYAGRPVAFSLDINERPLIDFRPGGLIYIANSSDFLIRVFSKNGNLVRHYRFPYERLRLKPEEEIFSSYTYNRQLLMVRESAEYPEYWPALYHLFLDDQQRIWVSTVKPDREVSEWFVIDDSKKQIAARFEWPVDKPIWDVKNGRAYTVESDSAGFKMVVSYDVEFDAKIEGYK